MSTAPSFVRIARHSAAFVLGLILLVFGLPILATGIRAGGSDRRLARNGVLSQGTVIARSLNRDIRQRKGGATESRTIYVLRYRFAAGGGTTVEGEQAISEQRWKRLERDGPVAIRYLPADPFVNRVEGEARGGGGRLLTPVGGGLSLVGLACFLSGLLSSLRTRAILRDGTPLRATVATVDVRRVRGRTSCTIHYTYRDPAGTAREGKSPPMSASEADGWKPGATARIRIDPDRPERSAWVGREN